MVGTSAAHEVYVSILGKGLFKSVDHGKTWKKLSGGLPEDDDIMSLAIDFRDAKQLYAGSHNKGMFVSSDGGKHWRVPEIRQEPVKEIIDSLVPDQPSPAKAAVDIPPAFLKCTKCHGWADVALTRKKTFWRVSPNRRDWQQTVARMAMGAGLMPGEEQTIIQFLTAYSRTRQP
jgi:hypothetical protein